ncbi:5'/3'-nucleotidase SurE [Rhodospirillum rubrum]|uniref:5'/3'-nucleotidase SurE n=1 Tax=Rhodospirillum rubrum TaxID=1085 RepID=UPI001904F0B6|nr:5'/3'-nucleotidase SurE [Rhodospirillum rubrum]MBK1663569.1 5'/3'-nucleotidase SurE [Rhodospirillum rubrum]MBK1675630.1 5'/3'-nucleotidase SurE [Rhodospirillum rubrum]
MFSPLTDLSRARILLSNDDGFEADGLAVLERVARSLSDDVWIVAPETEQSGAGHALTIHDPLRFRARGEKRFSVRGTPTDCVLVAVNHLMDRPPDLVLSGINRGGNLGEDVHYSGTVAAAMEGTLLGLRAIALSQVFETNGRGIADPFQVAATHAGDVIRRVCGRPWNRQVLINVNFPDCPLAEVTGTELKRQGRRKLGDDIEERRDPRDRPYLWIGAQRKEDRKTAGTDLEAVFRGAITVTPLCVDMTDLPTIEALTGAF